MLCTVDTTSVFLHHEQSGYQLTVHTILYCDITNVSGWLYNSMVQIPLIFLWWALKRQWFWRQCFYNSASANKIANMYMYHIISCVGILCSIYSIYIAQECPPHQSVNGHFLSLASGQDCRSIFMMTVCQFPCTSNLCCATVLCCYNVKIRKWWRNLSFASSDAMSANIGCEVTSLVRLECVKGLHILVYDFKYVYNGASDLPKTIVPT